MFRTDIPPTQFVRELKPYRASDGAGLSTEEKAKYIKLDWNEATYPPSPLVKRSLLRFLEGGNFNYYPDVTAQDLREKIADYVDLPASYIQVFNGSDAALRDICNTYLSVGDNVLVHEPVYSQIFTFLQCMGANLVKILARDPFAKALDDYNRYLSSQDIRVMYIVNPNNPTGLLYERTEIESLLESHPSTLFIIDEAYSEFSGITVADLVPKHHNIIVVRTFSKAFGLAGLRIGYILSQQATIENIDRVRNGKEVNVLAQVAAMAALDDIPYMKTRVEEVRQTREWLVARLIESGVKINTTPANYVLIFATNVRKVVQELKRKRILVRDRSYLPQLAGYMRVSIGTLSRDENAILKKLIYPEINQEMQGDVKIVRIVGSTRSQEDQETRMRKERAAKSAAVVLAGNFMGLVLGFISSVIVAGYFGAGKQLDAFMAAYAIPDILSQILLSVSILLVVPVFIQYRTNEGVNSAMEIVNKFVTVSLTILLIGTVSFMLFSSFILKLTAPGFDKETHELSCNLLRILSVSVLLYGCWALTSSILQAQEHFASPALAGPIMQILTIFIMVLLSRQIGVYAYAIGILAGLFFGLMAQIPSLLKRGKLQIDFDFSHPAIKSIWVSLPPLLLARLLGHGTKVLITAVASTLAVGSISALGFAWKIVSIPMMIVSSLSVVLYPAISEEIAKKDYDTLKRILTKAIKVSIYIGAPFTILFILFRVPIVRVLFERGKFNPEQSFLTAEVLMFYCIMIVFQSVNLLIGNTYWALRLMKIRLKIEAGGIIVCILLMSIS